MGRGTYLVAESPSDNEKTIKPALDELIRHILQPPTALVNLDLKVLTKQAKISFVCSENYKASSMDLYLDRSTLEACFEGQRLNLIVLLPPETKKVSGKIGLFLGEGSVQVTREHKKQLRY